MEDIIAGLAIAFIVGGLLGSINYFNSVGGFSTGKGRIGCLMAIIGTIGVFTLGFLYELFISKDTESFLLFFISLAVCLILYSTTKMFPNFYSKKGISKKEKAIIKKDKKIMEDLQVLKKLLDNGLISEKEYVESTNELKKKLSEISN